MWPGCLALTASIWYISFHLNLIQRFLLITFKCVGCGCWKTGLDWHPVDTDSIDLFNKYFLISFKPLIHSVNEYWMAPICWLCSGINDSTVSKMVFNFINHTLECETNYPLCEQLRKDKGQDICRRGSGHEIERMWY